MPHDVLIFLIVALVAASLGSSELAAGTVSLSRAPALIVSLRRGA